MTELMRIGIDSSRHPLYGKTCGICNQPMRSGQEALVHDAGRGVYVQRETIWHRSCLRAFLEREWPKTPKTEKTDRAIEKLRKNGSRVPALLADV